MTQERTAWVIGTSVSIEDGGYVTHLSARLRERGVTLRNLSVGDQTSVMGFMRTLGHLEQMASGDVVVWEYSLLDTLLTERLFPASDVRSARRQAWLALLERDVSVVVVLSAPREYLDRPTSCEREIHDDAARLGLAIVDMRQLFRSLGIADPITHFRDDRHPRTDSAIVPATADAVVAAIDRAQKIDRAKLAAWKQTVTHWRWIDTEKLQEKTRCRAQTFSNSLVTIQAVPFSASTDFRLPGATSRVIAVGCISTHESAALWCGHADCAATSVRLPANLPYAFLLRVTSVACRHVVQNVRGATTASFQNGVWTDYGQATCDAAGTVAVFGILVEPETRAAKELMRKLRSIPQRVCEKLRKAFRAG